MTMFAVRVHNSTRSCILMRQFGNGVWTIPMTIIPENSDPLKHLDTLLEQIDGDYELMSALNIVNYVDVLPNGGRQHSIVYDIKYKGRIHTPCPAKYIDRYSKSQWMQIDAVIKHKGKTSWPTEALIIAMEADANLR